MRQVHKERKTSKQVQKGTQADTHTNMLNQHGAERELAAAVRLVKGFHRRQLIHISVTDDCADKSTIACPLITPSANHTMRFRDYWIRPIQAATTRICISCCLIRALLCQLLRVLVYRPASPGTGGPNCPTSPHLTQYNLSPNITCYL